MDRQTPVNPYLGVHNKELRSLTLEEKVISYSFEALAPLLTRIFTAGCKTLAKFSNIRHRTFSGAYFRMGRVSQGKNGS
jgi:hypothetical protein